MKIILSAMLLLFVSIPTAADDVAVLRQNMVGYYSAAGADLTSARMQESLAALEWNVETITRPDFLSSDGSFADVNYSEIPSGSWSPWEHFRRMTVMAKAYRTPGQRYYRNATLRAQINSTLWRARSIYGPTTLPLGNWWFWVLGVPLDLGPTLVMMQGDADQAVVDDLTAAMAGKLGGSPTSRGIVGPVPTGQNLVWSAFAHLCVGVLRNEPVRLGQVRDAMATVTLPSATLEGVKPDWSFHQHGPQLYTGGYGGAFGGDVARYSLLARNTSLALPPASNEAFANYLVEGIAWSLYGNHFDVSVVGREVAKRTTSGFNGLAGLLHGSVAGLPRDVEIRAATLKMLETWTWTLPTELAALTTRVAQTTAASPSGHRHYYASDFTVHRRPGWYASIKMLSTRTKSGESTNGENMLGARQSDGRMYLVLNGDDYFGRDVWPAMDWARLPGITVEVRPDAANDTYGFGKHTFAGGTGDGRNGVSAMEVAPVNSVLSAKKSWFFFDDSIVFLTNSITSPGTYPVETIVNQWPMRSATTSLSMSSATSPEWIVTDGIGYYFPIPASNVKTVIASKSGAWTALAPSDPTPTEPVQIVTTYFDHGVQPVNASSEYVIVPRTTPEQMRQWIASRPLKIVANTPSVSAVRDQRLNAIGITFWNSSGVVEGMQADAPLVAYLVAEGTGFRLSAADPNAGTTGVIRFTLPGYYASTDARVTWSGGATIVEIPRNGGKTTDVRLTRSGLPRARAVRR